MGKLFAIEMGAEVTDQVTGFKGVVTGRAEYLTGCRQYGVQPKMKKGEKSLPRQQWFDEDRLIKKPAKKRNPGGPQAFPAPIR